MKELLRFAAARMPWLYRAATRVRPDRDADRRVFLHLVQDGDHVLDVGANVGWYTLLFSHLVGSRGRVVAFEPMPETAERFQALLDTHRRFDNVELVRAAVADEEGAREIHQPDEDHGQASLTPHRHGAWSQVARVRRRPTSVVTLDGWAARHSLERLNFVKIDIEGAELLALRGARGLLTRHRPMLYLEVYEGWTRSFGYEPRDLVALLLELGYTRLLRVAGDVSPLPPGDAADLGRALATQPQNLLCLRGDDPSHRRCLERLLRRKDP